MPGKKQSKPEFYKDFMESGFFPDAANKVTKYQESNNFWIFRTGNQVYKIRKKIENNSAIDLAQLFCSDIVNTTQIHSPDLSAVLMSVVKNPNGYALVDASKVADDQILYHVIALKQIPQQHLLENIIQREKVSEKVILPISQFLANFHKETQVREVKGNATADIVYEKINNAFYQSKKYMNQTITQTVIDMVHRPLEKFLADHKKLIAKRGRKGFSREIHGSFLPTKIFIHGDSVSALGKTSEDLKEKYGEVAWDLADLLVELHFHGLQEYENLFLEEYIRFSEDKEMKQIIFFYKAVKCLERGLEQSNLMAVSQIEEEKIQHQETAVKYYEQTIDVVHQFV